ncbi:MAG: hypothetical protein NG740_01015 [Omnitrophica bacterium]|nr:hypothetical protein [Candidatus Omnitrophota bacterium]
MRILELDLDAGISPINITKTEELKRLGNRAKKRELSHELQSEGRKIRKKFDLPINGIKKFPRGKKLSESEKKQHKEKNKPFNLILLSLLYDDEELKERGIEGKSRKKEYEEDIRELRRKLFLPMEFQKTLAHWYIPYNKIPAIYTHSSGCQIWRKDVDGERILFVSVTAKTRHNDYRQVWSCIEEQRDFYYKSVIFK